MGNNTAPSSGTSRALERLENRINQLDAEKADEKVVRLLIDGVNHVCSKEKEFEKMERAIDSWTKWFRGGILGFILMLVTVGTTLFFEFSDLSRKSERTEQKIDNLSSGMAKLEQEREKKRDDDLSEIRATIEEAFKNARDTTRGYDNGPVSGFSGR